MPHFSTATSANQSAAAPSKYNDATDTNDDWHQAKTEEEDAVYCDSTKPKYAVKVEMIKPVTARETAAGGCC